MRQFTRKEILKDLRAKTAREEPIIIGGAGLGLIAKVADRAGIDLIMAYNTGPFRMDGHPSCTSYLAYGDSNAITLDLGRRLLKLVDNTPVVAGIGAGDPYRSMDSLIGDMMDLGFSGITNVPTAGAYDGRFRLRIDTAGMGYPEEVALIAGCHRRDIFTVAYVYTPEEVRAMVQAGADVVSAHVGATTGGAVGARNAYSMEETCRRTLEMFEAARAENPEVIFVCHGGAIGSFEISRVASGRGDGISFELWGTRGAIRWDQQQLGNLELCREDDPADRRGFKSIAIGGTHPYGSALWTVANMGLGDNKTIEIHDMLEAFDKDQLFNADFYDGLKVAQVVEAVQHSSEKTAGCRRRR